MSQSSNEPEKKGPEAGAALHRRDLSDAELASVAGGGGDKKDPGQPEKPPGGKKP